MRTEDRKAAVSAYKERKVEGGIYAVRCQTSDEIWVGGAPDLSKIQNRLWFTLRQGTNTHPSLQNAWSTNGSEAFDFEVVETLNEESVGYVRNRVMKERLAWWAEKLRAAKL